ncbi:MAG: cytochrome c [Anaerolineales bacterium]|nr:cytochrome c [Anaerolineales bacterium]
MKKLLKWIGILLAVLIGLLIVALAAAFVTSNSRANRTYGIQVESVTISTDAEIVERGRHLAVTRGCVDCHGGDFSGGSVIDDPAIAVIYAPNLTPGKGGLADYGDSDWVRAIRHGVDQGGKPLFVMPSQEYYFMSDEDLGAVLAYLKQVPAVENQTPQKSLGVLGRVLFVAGMLGDLPAEIIDHTAARPTTPEMGVSKEYGAYLAVNCIGCHGENYAGSTVPGSPPDALPAANLTPTGAIANWSEADFLTAMHTGVRPDGSQIDRSMLWWSLGKMTDEELKALWLFLQSVPPVESVNQQ